MDNRPSILNRILKCCARAIAASYLFFRTHNTFAFCLLLGLGLGLAALIILELFGASALQEAKVAGAVGLLGTVIGLLYPIVSDRAKRKEEQRQEEQRYLDTRFREIQGELKNCVAAIDGRLDLVESRLATHTHPDLVSSIKEAYTIAIACKVRLEALYEFDDTKQQVKAIQKKIEAYEQQQ